jgi:RNA polymerase sigma-B factor
MTVADPAPARSAPATSAPRTNAPKTKARGLEAADRPPARTAQRTKARGLTSTTELDAASSAKPKAGALDGPPADERWRHGDMADPNATRDLTDSGDDARDAGEADEVADAADLAGSDGAGSGAPESGDPAHAEHADLAGAVELTDSMDLADSSDLDDLETEEDAEDAELGGEGELETPAPRAQHGPRERGHARDLFEQLSALPSDDPERLRIRSELVELHLPLVEYLARRFRNRGEWLDDLTQVATIGLIKSIDRFDLERGVEFSTYATPTIVGEIKRHFRDKGWAVRVPRRLQELKLALAKAIGELAQNLGRAPTVGELAGHLQMSEEEVLEGLESANAYSTVSLDAPDSGDDDAPAVAESLGMVDDALEGVEYRESLKPLLEQLPPREKRILLLRFFGNMTQSQIATELGISQMHVSRLLARTLAQLRDGLTSDE